MNEKLNLSSNKITKEQQITNDNSLEKEFRNRPESRREEILETLWAEYLSENRSRLNLFRNLRNIPKNFKWDNAKSNIQSRILDILESNSTYDQALKQYSDLTNRNNPNKKISSRNELEFRKAFQIFKSLNTKIDKQERLGASENQNEDDGLQQPVNPPEQNSQLFNIAKKKMENLMALNASNVNIDEVNLERLGINIKMIKRIIERSELGKNKPELGKIILTNFTIFEKNVNEFKSGNTDELLKLNTIKQADSFIKLLSRKEIIELSPHTAVVLNLDITKIRNSVSSQVKEKVIDRENIHLSEAENKISENKESIASNSVKSSNVSKIMDLLELQKGKSDNKSNEKPVLNAIMASKSVTEEKASPKVEEKPKAERRTIENFVRPEIKSFAKESQIFNLNFIKGLRKDINDFKLSIQNNPKINTDSIGETLDEFLNSFEQFINNPNNTANAIINKTDTINQGNSLLEKIHEITKQIGESAEMNNALASKIKTILSLVSNFSANISGQKSNNDLNEIFGHILSFDKSKFNKNQADDIKGYIDAIVQTIDNGDKSEVELTIHLNGLHEYFTMTFEKHKVPKDKIEILWKAIIDQARTILINKHKAKIEKNKKSGEKMDDMSMESVMAIFTKLDKEFKDLKSKEKSDGNEYIDPKKTLETLVLNFINNNEELIKKNQGDIKKRIEAIYSECIKNHGIGKTKLGFETMVNSFADLIFGDKEVGNYYLPVRESGEIVQKRIDRDKQITAQLYFDESINNYIVKSIKKILNSWKDTLHIKMDEKASNLVDELMDGLRADKNGKVILKKIGMGFEQKLKEEITILINAKKIEGATSWRDTETNKITPEYFNKIMEGMAKRYLPETTEDDQLISHMVNLNKLKTQKVMREELLSTLNNLFDEVNKLRTTVK